LQAREAGDRFVRLVCRPLRGLDRGGLDLPRSEDRGYRSCAAYSGVGL